MLSVTPFSAACAIVLTAHREHAARFSRLVEMFSEAVTLVGDSQFEKLSAACSLEFDLLGDCEATYAFTEAAGITTAFDDWEERHVHAFGRRA